MEELKQKKRKEFADSKLLKYLMKCPPMIDEADMMSVADWWLERLDLAVKETEDRIIDWCEKRCKENMTTYGTDKWNSDLEELIDYLKNK